MLRGLCIPQSVSTDCPALGTREDNLNQCKEIGLSGGSLRGQAQPTRGREQCQLLARVLVRVTA